MKKSDWKKAEKEFKKLTRDKFPRPDKLTQLRQTRKYMLELHKVIRHFEQKFHYVPDEALLLFNEYNQKQEKMLFDKFQEEFAKR